MECQCEKCGMGVKGMQCAKCGENLVQGSISSEKGQVHVAKCPNGCGKIKALSCCGQEMTCSA